MTLQEVRSMLAWCMVFNFVLMTLWLLFYTLAHDWTYQMHSKLYKISEERFDAVNYAGLALYKGAVFVFNLVPYLALRIVG